MDFEMNGQSTNVAGHNSRILLEIEHQDRDPIFRVISHRKVRSNLCLLMDLSLSRKAQQLGDSDLGRKAQEYRLTESPRYYPGMRYIPAEFVL